MRLQLKVAIVLALCAGLFGCISSDSLKSANGGTTVDSEYIIFVIDTSGSMLAFAWPTVVKQFEEVMDLYPDLEGVQVLNDMGETIFPGFRGEWIEYTPESREAVVERFQTWSPFSNSNPIEGIEEAINTYYEADKRISIYVFGDDFHGNSIHHAVNRITSINPKDKEGKCLVRIYGVGFPVYFDNGEAAQNVYLYGSLMRTLTRSNCGTFVALSSLN